MTILPKSVGVALLGVAGVSVVATAAPLPTLGQGTTPSVPTSIAQMKKVVEVDRHGIYLDQIIEGGPSDWTWPHLKLADSPAFGQQLTVTLPSIVQRLAISGIELPELTWGPQQTTLIALRSRMLTQSELEEHLFHRVLDKLGEVEGDVKLRLARSWNSMRIPDEGFELEIDGVPTTGLRSRFMIRFQLMQHGVAFYSSYVPVEAELIRPVWVSEGRLGRGDMISENNVRLVDRDVLSVRGATVPPDQEFSGMEVISTVTRDTPLLRRHLRMAPVVDRGDVVDAVFQRGLLQISMKVEVLEEAAPGEPVRVRNLKTRKQLRGTVDDANTIRIL